MKKNLTELVFILDRSGSMSGLESDTIGGFNAMIAKQRKMEGEAYVSTVLFDNESVVLHDRVDIQKVQPMTEAQYSVRGCTALLDAVGKAIHHIGNVHKYAREKDRPEHTLFVITTDGMENASRRYTVEQVRQKIERQKAKYGWEFIFLGANVDAVKTAHRIGIDRKRAVRWMQEVGRPYPRCGYGGRFWDWMYSSNPQPYNSFGNGAAMRVSACGFVANSLEEAKKLSKAVTEVTHNHPEGIKGAEATTVAIYMARTGSTLAEIREVIDREYYSMNFTIDEIRDAYEFNETCQNTVPQALMAFFESTSFKDAIRNAISIGGDSDTLAAITGGIAEAYYGVPEDIRAKAISYLDGRMKAILEAFENRK